MPWQETRKMDQRMEFVLKAVKADNFRELCREYGISTKTGYKWRERFLEDGVRGTQELSRRPQNSPRGLSEKVVCEIIRIKNKRPAWGPRKVRWVYGRTHAQLPSESSFKRVLE